MMKHISILVPRGAVALSCIEGPFILFNKANEFLASVGKPALFQVQLVGLTREGEVYDRLFSVRPDETISNVSKTDLIIIPAVNGDMKEVIETNKDFFPWIKKMYSEGSEVASLCVGAFLLAATGLVDGKKCATHWISTSQFKIMFPNVDLAPERIITDENGIYSSGGANSFWNLLLYLLEKFTNREMAILFSKYYEIEIGRDSQSSFILFQAQKDHPDEVVKKAQEFIESNVSDRISVEDLAAKFAIGRRNFERRFKKATNNTPVEYIQRAKIEAAKKSLEASRKNVSEVMYDVGYTDTKAFRIVFKKITGLSPVDYRNKYNKQSLTFA
jgi:transcriptional regulator GlxA family with amidase domain